MGIYLTGLIGIIVAGLLIGIIIQQAETIRGLLRDKRELQFGVNNLTLKLRRAQAEIRALEDKVAQ